MPTPSKRAPAPKFLVISDSPHATVYTGTRDQLIALGVARPDHFPEGRKRVKWHITPGPGCGTDDFRTAKLKEDRFEFRKWHPYRPKVDQSGALKEFTIYPRSDSDTGYGFRVHIPGIDHREVKPALNDAVRYILDVANHALRRTQKQRLSLVKSDYGSEATF